MTTKPTILGFPGLISVSSIRRITPPMSGVLFAVFTSVPTENSPLVSNTGLSFELEPIPSSTLQTSGSCSTKLKNMSSSRSGSKRGVTGVRSEARFHQTKHVPAPTPDPRTENRGDFHGDERGGCVKADREGIEKRRAVGRITTGIRRPANVWTAQSRRSEAIRKTGQTEKTGAHGKDVSDEGCRGKGSLTSIIHNGGYMTASDPAQWFTNHKSCQKSLACACTETITTTYEHMNILTSYILWTPPSESLGEKNTLKHIPLTCKCQA